MDAIKEAMIRQEDTMGVPCRIIAGGGAHFGDDLWKCATCGAEKYPESFECPRGYDVERGPKRPVCKECDGQGIDEYGGTCLGCGGDGRWPFEYPKKDNAD